MDFVVQEGSRVVPIEVKSGRGIKSPSLQKFEKLFGSSLLRVRFSMKNLRLDDDMLNIPLPLADQAMRLIRLAHEQRQSH